jgi:predicted secreted protein
MKKLIIPFFVLSTLIFSCKNDDNKSDNKQTDYKEVTIGEAFQVSLYSPAADGGYRWEWIKNNPSIIDSVYYSYTVKNPELDGSPGTEIWNFKGIKSGTEKMKFEYKRSFEKNSTIETREIMVTVK